MIIYEHTGKSVMDENLIPMEGSGSSVVDAGSSSISLILSKIKEFIKSYIPDPVKKSDLPTNYAKKSDLPTDYAKDKPVSAFLKAIFSHIHTTLGGDETPAYTCIKDEDGWYFYYDGTGQHSVNGEDCHGYFNIRHDGSVTTFYVADALDGYYTSLTGTTKTLCSFVGSNDTIAKKSDLPTDYAKQGTDDEATLSGVSSLLDNVSYNVGKKGTSRGQAHTGLYAFIAELLVELIGTDEESISDKLDSMQGDINKIKAKLGIVD